MRTTLSVTSSSSVLLILLLMLMLGNATAQALPPGVGPLILETTKVRPTFPERDAIAAAQRYLSAPAAASRATFIQVTDSTPYGSIRKTVSYAWHVEMLGVKIQNPSTKATHTMRLGVLIDDNNQGSSGSGKRWLIGAYARTDPRGWVARHASMTPRDTWLETSSDGWRIDKARIADHRSSIVNILESFWQASGLDPSNGGEVFVRPRHGAPTWPVSNVDGRLRSLLVEGPYWTVQVRGVKTITVSPPSLKQPSREKGELRYMTGLIELFDDRNARVVRGIFLP